MCIVPDTRPCPSPAPDAGFTLIELLVAMVVILVVGAIFTGTVLGGFRASGKMESDHEAQAKVQFAVAQFSDDAAKMKSPDRDESTISDPVQLQRALVTDAGISDPPSGLDTSGSSIRIDAADILEASNTRLLFRADVLPAAGTECVLYEATADRQLVRTVHAYVRANPAQVGSCNLASTLVRTVLLEEVDR